MEFLSSGFLTVTEVFSHLTLHHSVGAEVAKYIEKHFIRELKKIDSYKKKDYRNALQDCFMKLD